MTGCPKDPSISKALSASCAAGIGKAPGGWAGKRQRRKSLIHFTG